MDLEVVFEMGVMEKKSIAVFMWAAVLLGTLVNFRMLQQLFLTVEALLTLLLVDPGVQIILVVVVN